MSEHEMIVITERKVDPRDTCQYDHPMSFCPECGCWMNCKRDGIDLEYRRRPDERDR
jgi:hypothetical protein